VMTRASLGHTGRELSASAPTNDWPPLVQKYFDRPPVRDPSEDQQTLLDNLCRQSAALTHRPITP
ncbi:MAG: hypothetical protein WBX77_06680, partial [Pseudolabrys sp.]